MTVKENPMTVKKIADLPAKATPLEPGDPVVVPSILGGTFAERKAARLKAIQSAENKVVKRAESK